MHSTMAKCLLTTQPQLGHVATPTHKRAKQEGTRERQADVNLIVWHAMKCKDTVSLHMAALMPTTP